jgi:hypothetical protein
MWIVDAHRDNGKRFVVQSDEKLTAFLELERATRESLLCYIGRFGARTVAARVHRFADPVEQFWRRILTGNVQGSGHQIKTIPGEERPLSFARRQSFAIKRCNHGPCFRAIAATETIWKNCAENSRDCVLQPHFASS